MAEISSNLTCIIQQLVRNVDQFMPVAIIAVVVLGALGVGAYFFTSSPTPATVVTEPDATEVARTDTETPNNDTVEAAPMSGDGDDDDTTMMEMHSESGMADSTTPNDETAAATPYSSEQTYLTPARTSHEIDVTLTVAADGTIVGANVTYDNGDGYSNPNQERFDNAYQEMVVGQNISDVELAVTGGASLTTGAFNDAIADIRNQTS